MKHTDRIIKLLGDTDEHVYLQEWISEYAIVDLKKCYYTSIP